MTTWGWNDRTESQPPLVGWQDKLLVWDTIDQRLVLAWWNGEEWVQHDCEEGEQDIGFRWWLAPMPPPQKPLP